MLEKIKGYALAVVSVIVGILVAVVYALQGRLAAREQQLQTEKAKGELADALQRQAVDTEKAKQADADFERLAHDYERTSKS